jgi:hypothetical protein
MRRGVRHDGAKDLLTISWRKIERDLHPPSIRAIAIPKSSHRMYLTNVGVPDSNSTI